MKKLMTATIICTVLFCVFSIFYIKYSGVFEDKEVFTLSHEMGSYSKNGNYISLGQHYSDTSVVGWMDDSILFRLSLAPDRTNDLYRYYPADGRSEVITLREELIDISAIISGDKKNILINHEFSCNNSMVIDLLKERRANSDYEYHVAVKENNSFFENYNLSTKKREKLFDYTVSLRGDKEFNNIFKNVKGTFSSNNLEYLMNIVHDNGPHYDLVKYSMGKKSVSNYKLSFKETNDDIYRFLIDPAISNDGNTMWIIERLDVFSFPSHRESTLYMLDLKAEEIHLKAIASNLSKFLVSSNNNYIIYSKEPIEDNSELRCIDLRSRKDYKIGDNVLNNGFVFSSSDHIAAYLVKADNGAKLYLTDLSDERSESSLKYTFAEFLEIECIDFSSDRKSLFISYYANKDKKVLKERQMCLIKLN